MAKPVRVEGKLMQFGPDHIAVSVGEGSQLRRDRDRHHQLYTPPSSGNLQRRSADATIHGASLHAYAGLRYCRTLTTPCTQCRAPLEPRQYAAEPYRAVLERHGIAQSMSRKGDCLDNAPVESLFASLKVEHVHQARYRTCDEARAALFDHLEIFYNRQRLHSGLGYRTPAEARAAMIEVRSRMAA